MAADRLLLALHYTERADYGHDGVVVAIRSNLRWCPDGFEFTCWNGEVARGAFVIDGLDRDITLEAVETCFSGVRAGRAIKMRSDNDSAYSACETRTVARQLGLKPCFTTVRSPQSNGISEAFVYTLKRDCVRVLSLPDAFTAQISSTGFCSRLNPSGQNGGQHR